MQDKTFEDALTDLQRKAEDLQISADYLAGEISSLRVRIVELLINIDGNDAVRI